MNPDTSQAPDLASILQTLAAYAPRQLVVPAEKSDLEEGEYDPSQFDPIQAAAAPPLPSKSFDQSTPVPRNSTSTHSTVKKATPPSLSTITTWPNALSYTIKYIFPNPDKKRRIQHLIQTQHRHEQEWWASRKELIRKAQGRDKSRMELDSVLASVGGLVATSSHLQGEAEGDEVTKELAVFDRKVLSACRQMVDASSKEMHDLGIPFFCSGISDKIEKNKLQSLKKQMLQLLEDYCGSENSEG